MKPFMPGRPIEASVINRKAATSLGMTALSPPYSAISRVCRRSESMPTIRNNPPVLTPCASIWNIAPCTPCVFMVAMPSTMMPMWLTDEYATSFFMSGCTIATSAPYTMPMTARTASQGANAAAARGNSGKANRMNP
jgi:hypothetical protein